MEALPAVLDLSVDTVDYPFSSELDNLQLKEQVEFDYLLTYVIKTSTIML
jgi:hypothetical protein